MAATKVVLVVRILKSRGAGDVRIRARFVGPPGRFVAAALYVYSPYLQYRPHIRGALPEAFSFGVFPLALWALDGCDADDGRLLGGCVGSDGGG